MSRSAIVRTSAVLVLCCVLTTPGASAAPVRSEEGAAREFAGWLWEALSALWEKAGCQLDPNGRCVEGQEKNGCRADPFGRCIEGQGPSSSQTEVGCTVDPYDRCGG